MWIGGGIRTTRGPFGHHRYVYRQQEESAYTRGSVSAKRSGEIPLWESNFWPRSLLAVGLTTTEAGDDSGVIGGEHDALEVDVVSGSEDVAVFDAALDVFQPAIAIGYRATFRCGSAISRSQNRASRSTASQTAVLLGLLYSTRPTR